MTDREKAIVMAFTGTVMLTGDKFDIYHKYIQDIMGRPIWTHELAEESVVTDIKNRSHEDFIKVCNSEDPFDMVIDIIDAQEKEWGSFNGKIVSERIRARVLKLKEETT